MADYDETHRIWSASATFQKGLYHLFVLKRQRDADAYALGLRTYQSLFFLAETGYLLDFRNNLTGEKPDPAAIVTHVMLRGWGGFPAGHPMNAVSTAIVRGLRHTWETRSNLLYRPYMQIENAAGFYEDCTLQDLLSSLIEPAAVQRSYLQFLESVGAWGAEEEEGPARRFLTVLMSRYVDRPPGRLPTVALLRRYAIVITGKRRQPRGYEQYEREWQDKVLSVLAAH